MTKQKLKSTQSEQLKAFAEAARKLGCDDDEAAFDSKLKAVASAPPPKSETKNRKTRKRGA